MQTYLRIASLYQPGLFISSKEVRRALSHGKALLQCSGTRAVNRPGKTAVPETTQLPSIDWLVFPCHPHPPLTSIERGPHCSGLGEAAGTFLISSAAAVF